MKPTSKLNQLQKLNETFLSRKNPLYAKLSPACHHYYSDIIPVNLFELTEPETELSGIEEIFVRDGLFTMFHFFMKFPSPGKILTRFLIHETLISFVPHAWKNQVHSYSYHVQLPQKNSVTGLVIKGILSDALQFEESIRQDYFKRDYKHVYFMPTSKSSIFSNSSQDQQIILEKALVKTWDEIKIIFPSVKIVTTAEVRQETDFYDIEFFDLNRSGLLYIDDSTSLYLLSRGARPCDTQTIDKNDNRFHQIGPHHGVFISPAVFSDNQFAKIMNELTALDIKPMTSDCYSYLGEKINSLSTQHSPWKSYAL